MGARRCRSHCSTNNEFRLLKRQHNPLNVEVKAFEEEEVGEVEVEEVERSRRDCHLCMFVCYTSMAAYAIVHPVPDSIVSCCGV